MRRPERDYRDDALGTHLARGFGSLRSSEPSPDVWRRIERQIAPSPGGGARGWLDRWRVPGGGDGSLSRVLAWAAVPSAVALSVLVFLGGGPQDPTARGRPAHGMAGITGLSAAELAYQPHMDGLWLGVPSTSMLRAHVGPRQALLAGADTRREPVSAALGVAVQ